MLEPRAQLSTTHYFAYCHHRLLHCAMTTPESWATGDVPPNVSNCSTTTVVLNSGIKTLTAFKDIVEAIPVKPVFEAAITILTLVRVRLLVLFKFLHLLTCGTTRTR